MAQAERDELTTATTSAPAALRDSYLGRDIDVARLCIDNDGDGVEKAPGAETRQQYFRRRKNQCGNGRKRMAMANRDMNKERQQMFSFSELRIAFDAARSSHPFATSQCPLIVSICPYSWRLSSFRVLSSTAADRSKNRENEAKDVWKETGAARAKPRASLRRWPGALMARWFDPDTDLVRTATYYQFCQGKSLCNRQQHCLLPPLSSALASVYSCA